MFSISSLVSLTKVTQIATDCKGQLNYEQFWRWKSKNKTKQKKRANVLTWYFFTAFLSCTANVLDYSLLYMNQANRRAMQSHMRFCQFMQEVGSNLLHREQYTVCTMIRQVSVLIISSFSCIFFSSLPCKNWTLTGYYVMCTCAMVEGVAYGEQHPISRCQ